MNITIGSHRLRDFQAGYVIEYRQDTRDGVTRWRRRLYPSTIHHGLELLLKWELKSKSAGCTDVRELIELVKALLTELNASVQLVGSSNAPTG